jgi:hypothetical protein
MEDGRPARPATNPGQQKNGPIAGATSKRGKVEGLTQEWRCGEPIRQPERQQERCRTKQRVKVIAFQRPLLVTSTSAFAQPKPLNPRPQHPTLSKLLLNMNLSKIQEVLERKSQTEETKLKCKILHIRCKL